MVTFRVPDMSCGHCASTIVRTIASVDRDARIEVNVADKLVRVSGHAGELELADAIKEAGYATETIEAVPTAARAIGGCCCGSRATASIDARQEPARGMGSCCN